LISEKKFGGKKVGGRGSGRRASLLVDKTTDFRSIDLASYSGLSPGARGRVSWWRGDQEIGSIRFSVERSGLRLYYQTRWRNDEWRDINELIPFIETATNFGGWRRWFKCLTCERPCRNDSQYEPSFGSRKVHRLRERLGYSGLIEDPFPPKPKGMHWATYRRLEAEDERLRRLWAAGACNRPAAVLSCLQWSSPSLDARFVPRFNEVDGHWSPVKEHLQDSQYPSIPHRQGRRRAASCSLAGCAERLRTVEPSGCACPCRQVALTAPPW
jgi:hypothetical protein